MNDPQSDRVSWHKRLRDIVESAAGLPASGWAEFVARATDDADLAKAALELLQDPSTSGGGELLCEVARASREELLAELQQPVPTVIGPYEVVERLGAGGMGVVYKVRQTQPIARQLAVKVIPPQPGWRDLAARFRVELETLAAMEHRYIASLIDAGESDVGPWLAMELVDGQPLTAWCDARGSSLTQRLELFLMVCEGVHHAHTRGVVHRDLKPSNILVAVQDDAAVPKILDFGIAKVLDGSRVAAARQGRTAADQPIGTREYMAPEQTGNGVPIDTRADVYSLGVILQELVAGELPFPGLTGMDTAAAAAVICQQEPGRPSQRLMHSAERGAIAQRRATTVGHLHRALARDIDWIVLKAIRKAPGDRYASVSELRADVQRCLDAQPVLARAGARAYQWERFIHRHRLAVSAATAVLLAIVSTLVVVMRSEQALAAQVRAYDLLSNLVAYDRLVEAEEALRPATPEMLADLRQWLVQSNSVIEAREEVEEKLMDLIAHAPRSEPESAEGRKLRAGAVQGELEALRHRLAANLQAQDVRSGAQQLEMPELMVKPGWEEWDAAMAATARIGEASAAPQIDGEQALGLQYAFVSSYGSRGTAREAVRWALMGHALLMNGQDEAALEAAAAAVDVASPMDKPAFEDHVRETQGRVRDSQELIASDRLRIHNLTRLARFDVDVRFERAADQYQYAALLTFLANLDHLTELADDVRHRIQWASRIVTVSSSHPKARHSWAEVRQSLAVADDVVASRLYRGRAMAFDDRDVLGLVPLGVNPVTKLWEFYDLRTAEGDPCDPGSLEIPFHDPMGNIHMTGATGVVLVLLPGGCVSMGAQREVPDCAHFDPMAGLLEGPVHEVDLAPFFISKYELTQGQWSRCARGPDAYRFPSSKKRGGCHQYVFEHREIIEYWSLAAPVESVDWNSCADALVACGMLLPTEAQWEYASRAGSTGAWGELHDFEGVEVHENLLDRRGSAVNPSWPGPGRFDDGRGGTSPVGSYRCNAFGLFDTLGNVSEWCLDGLERYDQSARRGDGLRVSQSEHRVYRGGNHASAASMARVSSRFSALPNWRGFGLGLRPARPLRRGA